MKYQPFPYQEYTTRRIIENTCGPLLDMGLGKTVSTLTAIDHLIYEKQEVKKVLVVAPLRIADEVWSTEIAKWDHLNRLRLSKVLGSEKERKQALRVQADIYVINRENIPWLVAQYGTAWPFDMIVVDESSSFKNPQSKRFKALRKVRPLAKRVYTLTGTPTPNGLLGLWPQVYLLDRGERLGESFSNFRKQYFDPDKRNGETIFSYAIKRPDRKMNDILGRDIFEKEIHDKIGDICFSMKASDYLDLPARIDRIRQVQLGAKVQAQYDEFERDQVLTLLGDQEITAFNSGALTSKLMQYANGAIYDENKDWHEVHDAKLAALEEIVEAADGNPVLVFYSFKHDLERIKTRLSGYRVRTLQTAKDIHDWNDGKIEVLLAHPASAGHGLNLQAGGNIIVWFGLTFDLELFQQANARLHRMGQTKPVIIHYLIVKGTIDEEVVAALDSKSGKQEAVIRAVKARIDKHRKHAA